MVIGEISDGKISSSTCELLNAGQMLDDTLKEGVVAALLGSDPGKATQDAIAHGADKVYLVEDPLLKDYQIDAYLAALEKVCKDTSPSIILIARTLIGRDIGPRLAFRLGVAVAQDCIEVKIDPNTKGLVGNRPVYGGNAMAAVTFTQLKPHIAIVRPKSYAALETDGSRKGEVVTIQVKLDPALVKVKLIKSVKEPSEGVRLEDAQVVVSGGRGLGGPEPFKDLEVLAKLLKGAVGASRAVCDAGWVDYSHQVGLTGKTIAPDLYITVAISGASQHMAGCSGAKVVVAINKDSSANIFKEARYGVVGDWNKVLPAFTEAVRELTQS
ncbi:MAG: electron transfer flavoprotein subunit alpha/FixB family protein [Chloroflexi bacterium]|nr:electron transfer flavoprotein subunit alpha/FixB family protein [Chloroflexota bacterium]